MTDLNRRKKKVVFCDFDGTITLSDNIVSIMRHFNPKGYEPIMKRVVSQQISIREGVGAMFALMPSSQKQEIIDYVISTAGIRDGFAPFLEYLKSEQIDFYVTSGGIDFFLNPLLEPFHIAEDHIFCNSADFSGQNIQITWPHSCKSPCENDCGMCKVTVIRRFPEEEYERILIGDSLTDFEGAKIADHVFSRSHLTTKCAELGVDHTPFETFFDILEHFKSNQGVLHS
ncbi:2-hydroxy-3-keto-5-methylthiopentenyl-1-phosphatephosphatase [Paenibacillus sediminis]|uniref:2-hydroxy-3-keto-5-methylthiopentenyl-1-phosphate phosphatase n=1 Tax=Paenibacillus sediminis TaxID=664909 RepID=A0ABS4GZX3_9BACL|nr:2-hydroxy-3-keto-5-methylthiopentenyl-1-phosphate phosphatase [Paenibacillus sediminis]MBP1935819.1 2-hydroxy-3-keto-5-methylthiopentenyl-1-phosphate phosphatase [Paenibacillus sediminis]